MVVECQIYVQPDCIFWLYVSSGRQHSVKLTHSNLPPCSSHLPRAQQVVSSMSSDKGKGVSVASVLSGMRARPEDGAWKLLVRYGQHMCTARNRRANSVVNAMELRARFEGTWTYKNERFPDIEKQFFSIGNQEIKRFRDIAKTFRDLLMSEIIYRYWKLLPDIGNYFPK